MEFGLNEAQTILKKEARKFLQNECPLDYVKEMIEDEKGYSPILWKKMAELGWMGVLFEEKYGGSEWDFFRFIYHSGRNGKGSPPRAILFNGNFGWRDNHE